MKLTTMMGHECLPQKSNQAHDIARGLNIAVDQLSTVSVVIDEQALADYLHDPWDKGMLGSTRSALVIAKEISANSHKFIGLRKE